jgi:hypothetical protein
MCKLSESALSIVDRSSENVSLKWEKNDFLASTSSCHDMRMFDT